MDNASWPAMASFPRAVLRCTPGLAVSESASSLGVSMLMPHIWTGADKLIALSVQGNLRDHNQDLPGLCPASLWRTLLSNECKSRSNTIERSSQHGLGPWHGYCSSGPVDATRYDCNHYETSHSWLPALLGVDSGPAFQLHGGYAGPSARTRFEDQGLGC
jgi:hypothetical protein